MTNDAPAQASVDAVREIDEISAAVGATGMIIRGDGSHTVIPIAVVKRLLDLARAGALSPPPTVGAEDEAVAWAQAGFQGHLARYGVCPMRSTKIETIGYTEPLYTRPAPADRQKVKVKALGWVDCDFAGSATVSEIGLAYTMQNGRGGWFIAVTGAGISAYVPGDFSSRDAAKAAAQADFETRIRASLASEKEA